MNTYKKTGRIVGILFIAATVAGVLGMVFSASLRSPDGLPAIAQNASQIIIASICTLVMAGAVAGIAIAAYPVLRKESESLALGYVGARLVEGILFIFTVFCWLTILVISRESSDAAFYPAMAGLLKQVTDWVSPIVLDLLVAPVHYSIFYFLLFRSKLVPRWLSIWGLLGTLIWAASGFILAFNPGGDSSIITLLNMPIAINEMVLAVWLLIKGFTPPSAE